MRHVLITGASRGIGLALALAHLAAGWRVTGTHRGDAVGHGIGWVLADVTGVASLRATAAAIGPGLDRLVCNAGVYPDKGQGGIADLTPEAMAMAFAVNVTGVAMTVQAFLPALRAARGQVAIIGSQMGSTTRAPGGSLAYRASKAAVLNLGRNLAADLRGDGIAVGVYHPGWVRTDMGGAGADIEVDEAAAGLMERFAALSPATSGVFEGWDGRTIPY
jgi:NAD(P)-dependent dehydrogenase (short-subunit alcohol dehydrogenase family)